MSWWGSTGTADATEQAEERQRQAEERQRQAEERQRQAEEAAERERQRKAEEAAERQRQEEERKAVERQRKVEETERLRAAARERAIRACTRQEPDPYHIPGYASKEETSGWFSGW